jgi:hypothetical protein
LYFEHWVKRKTYGVVFIPSVADKRGQMLRFEFFMHIADQRLTMGRLGLHLQKSLREPHFHGEIAALSRGKAAQQKCGSFLPQSRLREVGRVIREQDIVIHAGLGIHMLRKIEGRAGIHGDIDGQRRDVDAMALQSLEGFLRLQPRSSVQAPGTG